MKTRDILWILLICILIFLAWSNGLISINQPKPPASGTPTATNDVVNAISTMTLTPGSGGRGQLETAIPTKTIVVDIADAELMRQLLHQKICFLHYLDTE